MLKNKLLLSFAVIALLALIGCHSPKEQNTNIEQTEEFATSTIPFTATLSPDPVAECAFLAKDDGLKFCGFENEISGSKIFSCTQTFQQSTEPFAKVVISAINYSHPAIQESDVFKSVSEKFEYDEKLDLGIPFLDISNLYLSPKNNRSKVEFFRGNLLVRITESHSGRCLKFEDLVRVVVEKAEERVKEE